MINVFRKLAVNLLRRLASDDVVVLDVNEWIALRAKIRTLTDLYDAFEDIKPQNDSSARLPGARMTEAEVDAWQPHIANTARGGREEIMDIVARKIDSGVLEAIKNTKS